jgi:hypothetical protein
VTGNERRLERPLEVLESRDLKRSSGFKRPSSAQARIKRPSRALESSVEISDAAPCPYFSFSPFQAKNDILPIIFCSN